MGYNDVIVCVTVINLTKAAFHRTGSISSDKSDWSNCRLWTQPLCYNMVTSKSSCL